MPSCMCLLFSLCSRHHGLIAACVCTCDTSPVSVSLAPGNGFLPGVSRRSVLSLVYHDGDEAAAVLKAPAAGGCRYDTVPRYRVLLSCYGYNRSTRRF